MKAQAAENGTPCEIPSSDITNPKIGCMHCILCGYNSIASCASRTLRCASRPVWTERKWPQLTWHCLFFFCCCWWAEGVQSIFTFAVCMSVCVVVCVSAWLQMFWWSPFSGGSFPFTIGRIEHGFNVRPDLCACDNNVNPRKYLGQIYTDSLVHDPAALKLLVDVIGEVSS